MNVYTFRSYLSEEENILRVFMTQIVIKEKEFEWTEIR